MYFNGYFMMFCAVSNDRLVMAFPSLPSWVKVILANKKNDKIFKLF